MDSIAEPTGDAPGAVIEPSSALRVVDTIRLFNGTQLGRVLNERQLHRHRVRAGRAFIQAPRNKYSRIRVLRYVAWLAEYRHLASQTGPLSGNINNEGITRILDAQSYRCALTGRHLQPEDASLDHIVPVSRGGPHLLENVQVLHTAVNRAKGALTTAEFIALCREVSAWADHPRDQEHAHA
jgi:5-methylcytosine-specific restriction endonuclease McrA